MIKACARCGQTFDGHPNCKYCDACRPIAVAELHRAARHRYYSKHRERIIRHNVEYARKKNGERPPKICAACGAEFEGHGNRKYCDACKKKSNAVRRKICRNRREVQLKVNEAAVQNLRERYLAWRSKKHET